MKIIRNIDGKKLELTLTNEEALDVFMDVLFDTKEAEINKTEIVTRGDGILAAYFKHEIAETLTSWGIRKPSSTLMQFLAERAQDVLGIEFEDMERQFAKSYDEILHWAEHHSKKDVQAAFEEAKRRSCCEVATFTWGDCPAHSDNYNDKLFAVVLEDILFHHPEIIGSKPTDAE